MVQGDRLDRELRDLFHSAVAEGVPDGADVAERLDSKMAARQRQRSSLRRIHLIAVPAAAVAAIVIGGAAVAAPSGNLPIKFTVRPMPDAAPALSQPGTPAQCVIRPQSTSVDDAKASLHFPVFVPSQQLAASLVRAQYADGCDGVRGLDLVYSVAGTRVEIVEAAASGTDTAAEIVVKGNAKVSQPSQVGWTIITRGDQQYAIYSKPATAKSPGGIYQAVWQANGTRFTLTPHDIDPASGAPVSGITTQTFESIITNLVAA